MAESHHALQTWVLILCNHFTLLKVIWFSRFQSYSVSNLYKQILQICTQNCSERTREEVYYQRFLEDGRLWLDTGKQIRLMAKEEVHLLSAIWCLLSFLICRQSHFLLNQSQNITLSHELLHLTIVHVGLKHPFSHINDVCTDCKAGFHINTWKTRWKK